MQFIRDLKGLHDPLWEVASGTQTLTADAESVTRLAAETDALEHAAAVEAVVVANQHPTGWFVHAVRRSELPEPQVALVREVIAVRTYLLLTHGPDSPTWRPAPVAGEWRSVSLSLECVLDRLEDGGPD